MYWIYRACLQNPYKKKRQYLEVLYKQKKVSRTLESERHDDNDKIIDKKRWQIIIIASISN